MPLIGSGREGDAGGTWLSLMVVPSASWMRGLSSEFRPSEREGMRSGWSGWI